MILLLKRLMCDDVKSLFYLYQLVRDNVTCELLIVTAAHGKAQTTSTRILVPQSYIIVDLLSPTAVSRCFDTLVLPLIPAIVEVD